MAIIPKQSLAEDSVDRYVHTWSVALLLFLSLVTWLLAASPLAILNSQDVQQPFQASCWCPAQFEASHVQYTNKVCADWYNDAYRSGRLSEYKKTLPNMPSIDPTDSSFPDTLIQKMEAKYTSFPEDSYFVSATVPLVLFIFAILLKLPQLLWFLLSSCFGVSVEKTLEAAAMSQSLEKSEKALVITDLVQSLSSALKSAPNRATLSYLFYKFFASILLALEAIVIAVKILPQTKKAGDEMKSEVLPCFYEIRQLQNAHQYAVQCIFAPTNEGSNFNFALQALFIGLLVYLVILCVISVVSLLTWLSKLTFGTCRSQVAARPSLPVDAYLLLYFSQDNAGPLVTRDLAQSEAWAAEPEEVGLIVESDGNENDGQKDVAEAVDEEEGEEKMDKGKEAMEKEDEVKQELNKAEELV